MISKAQEGDRFAITMVDGVAYTNPLKDERYKVKYYPVPPRDDLRAYIRLMESFERRFMHTAEGGREPGRHAQDLDDYIAHKREMYETATNDDVKKVEGAALCVALIDRGVKQAKKHMQHRLRNTKPDETYLNELLEKIGGDMTEALDYMKYVRRRRGHADVDGVLDEMKGEAFNIFCGTLPSGHGKMEQFHHNRILKAATAMQSIDRVVASMAELIKNTPQLHEAGMMATLEKLGESAKLRVQLQRDDPDFKGADESAMIARNAIHDFVPKVMPASNHLPAGYTAKKNVSHTTMDFIRQAADLIYDISVIRVHRNRSAEDLELRIAEYTETARSRST